MAALFDERSTGVVVKPVPSADFIKKGKPMLADRQHLDPSGDGLDLFEEFCDGGHVAIFHRDPNRSRIARRERINRRDMGRIGEQGLFDKNGQGVLNGDLLQLLHMAKVRACDQEAIDFGDIEKGLNAVDELRVRRELARLRSHFGVGLKDRTDRRVVQERDIAQMFLAHHATSDDAVSDGTGATIG